jgi:4-amino-4-deoxy-L-arabinose transferase-like glycosyltransferase
MSRSSATLILLALLIVFLAIGAAFAISTPQWQAPDEPAHYNYIKYIVEHGTLPVLEAGDYSQPLANYAHAAEYPNAVDRSLPRSYSPPLYYLLAAPVYAVSEGWLVAIRLLSVVLGGALVVVAYLIGASVPDVCPSRWAARPSSRCAAACGDDVCGQQRCAGRTVDRAVRLSGRDCRSPQPPTRC